MTKERGLRLRRLRMPVRVTQSETARKFAALRSCSVLSVRVSALGAVL